MGKWRRTDRTQWASHATGWRWRRPTARWLSVASTYSRENDAIYDGLSRPGVRLVSFAPILKHGLFPLADMLSRLLEIGEAGTSAPVEIEFAVDLAPDPRTRPTFAFLQMRPLALSRESAELEITTRTARLPSVTAGRCWATAAWTTCTTWSWWTTTASSGSGARTWHRTWRASTDACSEKAVPYMLVGVGRWGSSEPFLGIPVSWDQIAGARAIVEAGFRDFTVTPSQGTHFFQNLTSSNIGYFTVNPDAGDGFVDWEWLAAQPAVDEASCVRLLRFDSPVVVKMNGRTNEGVILKPGV